MTLASPVLAFFFFFDLLVPDRRALMRSRSLDLTYLVIMNHASMATAQITMITTTKLIWLTSQLRSNFQHFVEQIGAQANARAQQLFVKLGADSGGGETADHFAVGTQS